MDAGSLLLMTVLLSHSVLSFPSNTVDFSAIEVRNISIERRDSEAQELAFRQARDFEKWWKWLWKTWFKWLLPQVMSYSTDPGVSGGCSRSLTKYIGALTSAKVWAAKMVDAASKPPAGILGGTFSDFGDIDECLEITVPLRNGKEDFRGSYCTFEVTPNMKHAPKKTFVSSVREAGPHDTLSKKLLLGKNVFNFLKIRFAVCLPSSCNIHDVRNITRLVSRTLNINGIVLECYVKQDGGPVFGTIQVVVMGFIVLLLMLCGVGTGIEGIKLTRGHQRSFTGAENVLLAFSAIRNYKKLTSKGKSRLVLKPLHGIRSLSIMWIILGHSYVWANHQALSYPFNLQQWFGKLEIETILNAWLSVDTFFFLSGFLTCYSSLQQMQITGGKINAPLFILRRYIRFIFPLLMVMGLVFLLPLIPSSRGLWYSRIASELESCRANWWTSVLFVSNWTSMLSICVHPTWFLSADFQLHVLSLAVLLTLYRSAKLGSVAMGVLVSASSLAVAVLTYTLELPPTVPITSGNEGLLLETVNTIHMRTYAHVGPYVIGMATGYLMLKYKNIRFSRAVWIIGWCTSFTLSVVSVYGVHTWNTGHDHGLVITSLYASLHRSTFIIGVAWVVFACHTGQGGLVHSFLSLHVFAVLSRLTFCVYLVHSLVIWVRWSTRTERLYANHYNYLFETNGNLIMSLVFAFPLYLLVDAPVSNLDKLVFSKAQTRKEQEMSKVSGAGAEDVSKPPYLDSVVTKL